MELTEQQILGILDDAAYRLAQVQDLLEKDRLPEGIAKDCVLEMCRGIVTLDNCRNFEEFTDKGSLELFLNGNWSAEVNNLNDS